MLSVFATSAVSFLSGEHMTFRVKRTTNQKSTVIFTAKLHLFILCWFFMTLPSLTSYRHSLTSFIWNEEVSKIRSRHSLTKVNTGQCTANVDWVTHVHTLLTQLLNSVCQNICQSHRSRGGLPPTRPLQKFWVEDNVDVHSKFHTQSFCLLCCYVHCAYDIVTG